MALTKPTLLLTPAFDGNDIHIFYFNAIGGSQVVKNKLVIRNNKTNDIVYSETQESFKYEHSVPAKKLTNGVYYNAFITTFDKDGNESAPSDPIQFWCYTTPVFNFTNIPLSHIIPNASYSFEFKYEQAEGEKLNLYKVNLYNNFKSLISTSGEVYVKDGSSPFMSSYLSTGLQNETAYFLELEGVTVNNTILNTGLIEITVTYSRPDLFTLMELTDNCEEGYITIKSNFALVDGKSNPDPPKYIDDREVDVTSPDSWVEFSDGYELSKNFVSKFWFRKPNVYKEIIRFSNTDGQTISVNFMSGYETEESLTQSVYVEIYVSSVNGVEYYAYSNYIPLIDDTEYYCFWLTRKDNIFKLELQKV